MEDSLQKIMDTTNNNFTWRLEIKFGQFKLNFYTHQGKNYVLSDYEQIKYISNIKDAKQFLEILDALPKENWKRIKLKAYGGPNFGPNDIDKLKELFQNFEENWKKFIEDKGCRYCRNVDSVLWKYFVDDIQ